MKRQMREFMGRRGEDMAVEWMLERGWEVLDRRRKTRRGEIDVIARDGECIVFVEVKWRKRAGALDHAIDLRGLARVASASEAVAHEYAQDNEDLRIDVVLLAPGVPVRHIANAWQP